ncbi:hypothetical protein CYY_008586 [Polysphondylium violaceum]|uniref:DUF6748 domain-containing protein n=1 Tax=Polysphondylium violaceum TaxID=133409 RepID=A0A8J4PUY3_9MYCE|nr:hypothetical protein CYY_008586 [Polysphondylium violaceum]
MKSFLFLILVISTILLVPTCVLGSDNDSTGQASDKLIANEGDAQSAKLMTSAFGTKIYYSVKADTRNCPAPACGGFFLKRINLDDSDEELYVSEIYVTNQNINISMITNLKYLEGGQDNKIIISGQLKPSRTNGASFECLHLTDILHQMELPESGFASPKFQFKPKKTFYAIKASPFICNKMVTNCPNIVSYKINTDEMSFISSYTEDYSLRVPFIHKEWLVSRIFNEDDNTSSIVKGIILEGKLIISKIYVSIVDPVAPCPEIQANCLSQYGLVPSFYRNTDRCPVFDQCVGRGPCHLGVPSCPNGYHLYSLPSRNKGCPHYWCDPDFLQNPSNHMIFFK